MMSEYVHIEHCHWCNVAVPAKNPDDYYHAEHGVHYCEECLEEVNQTLEAD